MDVPEAGGKTDPWNRFPSIGAEAGRRGGDDADGCRFPGMEVGSVLGVGSSELTFKRCGGSANLHEWILMGACYRDIRLVNGVDIMQTFIIPDCSDGEAQDPLSLPWS